MENRRKFIKGVLGISGGLVAFSRLNAGNPYRQVTQKPDIESMSFCCLKCGPQCPIFNATVNNDLTAKQKIADNWAKKFGGTFTVDDVFCYGCKEDGKPLNKMLLKCTVRKCAKEKGLKSCSLCSDLEKCEKDLWTNWPNLKPNVLKIQKELNG
ncbi:MAG: DUF3795 domain-containing protein [Bacteroidia bacterium]|nr:DUF3795 domain-containing protein [Bacteroidia bacterium]